MPPVPGDLQNSDAEVVDDDRLDAALLSLSLAETETLEGREKRVSSGAEDGVESSLGDLGGEVEVKGSVGRRRGGKMVERRDIVCSGFGVFVEERRTVGACAYSELVMRPQ